ncbi:MAG: HD domain-containing protein [Lachnospiraceae bacterium]
MLTTKLRAKIKQNSRRHYTARERDLFLREFQRLEADASLSSMKEYIQHGHTSTYRHVCSVAKGSYWLSTRLNRLGIETDNHSLIRGALLHDYFLYDWHIKDENRPLHGFYHPVAALRNARKITKLTDKEENIIRTHMWPLSIRRIPLCREAVIVCLIDKLCTIGEVFQVL